MTTSMIQSQVAILGKSSSKFPTVIRLAKALSYNGAGLDFRAFSKAVAATLFLFFSSFCCGKISSISTSIPTLAK